VPSDMFNSLFPAPLPGQSSWETDRTLRSDSLRSWRWVGVSFLILILATAFADKMQRSTQIGLFAFCIVAVLFFTYQNEHEAVEVASLALSTLRMCFPWSLEQAVATEKVRPLRPTESR
jgi:hypothetical protein